MVDERQVCVKILNSQYGFDDFPFNWFALSSDLRRGPLLPPPFSHRMKFQCTAGCNKWVSLVDVPLQ